MSLDLHKASRQIERMAFSLQEKHRDKDTRLAKARQQLSQAVAKELNAKRMQGKVAFQLAELTERPAVCYQVPLPPPEFFVLAVDGSHIDVDRHSPARCYLINMGKVLLRYGAQPQALLSSEPRLYADEEDLILLDPASGTKEQKMEGPLLGIRRAVEEVQALAELAQEVSETTPVLALLDGSLILWGLAGQGYPPEFVRQALLQETLIPALDKLRLRSAESDLALASYISLPRSAEVANTLRLTVCPFHPTDCDLYCGSKRPGQRECDSVGGVTDEEIFKEVLAPGERSALFGSNSPVVERHYGEHRVYFFYVNVGSEIGRVEVPRWVAEKPRLLDLTHALIVDQSQRGHGYPAAIAEAHEQAVLTGSDRELFQRLVEEALRGQRLPVYTSEKSKSKRLRWL